MSDIVHSQLFLNADCRAILLPSILARIKELLESSDEVYYVIIKTILNVLIINAIFFIPSIIYF